MKLDKIMLTLFTISIIAVGTIGFSQSQATPQQNPERHIIVLNDDVNPWSVANEMAQERGLLISHVYGTAVNGFSGIVPPGQLDKISSDPRVKYIEQDYVMSIYAPGGVPGKPGGGGGGGDDPVQPSQVTPTGIMRINGNAAGTTDVNVAVIDTGIDPSHPDLNVIDGVNFASGKNWKDGNGHGTHVAGTIGALDNGIGVIGVAPGANLYAVRVLNNAGSGWTSDIIAGINWVADPANGIDVANMSLGGSGNDNEPCGGTDTYRNAICNAVNAGVTFVVAAGNSDADADNSRPATYDEVITVSALADFDGLPGGYGSPTCRNDVDDTFANFSNWGSDIDIIAPGVCIESTWKGGGYNTISGTSMASPHVAGAAALYIANNSNNDPPLSPEDVKSALLDAGTFNWNNDDDPDGIKEKLLYVFEL